jgi:cytochrome c-type biogenesis protein CcmH/NrfG
LKELLPPSVKPNFTSEVKNLINEILIYDSNNIDALFFQGLNAFTEGNKKNSYKVLGKTLVSTPQKFTYEVRTFKKT